VIRHRWARTSLSARWQAPAAIEERRYPEAATRWQSFVAFKEGTMSYAKQMLDSYSRTFNVDNRVLAATIDALNDCAQACTADVDADLGGQDVAEMVKCIRLCMECADICAATVTVTSRLAEYDSKITKPLLEACGRMQELR
jgi:hypothetical protein